MNNKNKQFLLTGPPGCGKTTLVKKVCTNLQKQKIPIYGFYTEELRVGGKRQGFDVVTLDNQRSPLARVIRPGVQHNGPVVGQYGVNKTSFEQAVLPLLAKQETGAVIIDEIGKMELFSNDFGYRVKQIFKENRVVLATVPMKPLPYVNQLKSANPSAVIIEGILNYGIQLWGPGADVKNVLLLEKKAIRIVTGADLDPHCKPIFIPQNLITVTHSNRDNLESELSQSIINALCG